MIVRAFGLQKNLMSIAVAKPNHLVFDRRTITRPAPADHACVQRRPVKAFADKLMAALGGPGDRARRSEEHTSELQSLMRISYAVFCLTKQNQHYNHRHIITNNNNNTSNELT